MSHLIRPEGELERVTVEVIDSYEIQDPRMKEMSYKEVKILGSGWVKATDPDEERGEPPGEVSVDYYPPDQINSIFASKKMVGDPE